MRSLIRPVDALNALSRIRDNTSADIDADFGTLAMLIAEVAHVRTAPEDNTGLPCFYCDQPQQRLNIERDRESGRVNVRIATAATAKDIAGIRKILGSFAK